jgi:hypothetical protein
MQQTLQTKTAQIFLTYSQKKTDMHHRYLFLLLKKTLAGIKQKAWYYFAG